PAPVAREAQTLSSRRSSGLRALPAPPRQPDPERRPAWPGLPRDLPAVIIDDLLHDGEPEPGAALLAGREQLEQPALHLGGDAGPVVGDLEHDPALRPDVVDVRRDAEPPALGHPVGRAARQ